MKSTPLKLIILILAIAFIVAIGAGSFALAYWSGSPELDLSGDDATVVDNDDDATYKYLIFAPIYDFDTEYCFEYVDSADYNGYRLKYEYGSDYVLEGGSHNAGSRNSAEAEKSTTYKSTGKTIAALIKEYGVKVIGYIGTLGQYEDLIIPSTITWDGADDIQVKRIDIKMTEYKESMDLLAGVQIASSIDYIDGVSFTGAGNLIKVKFLGDLPEISDYAFVGMNANIHYYDSTDTGIDSIRA